MKKLIITTIIVLACAFGYAQNYLSIRVDTLQSGINYHYCKNEVYGIILYPEENCSDYEFKVNGECFYLDSIILLNNREHSVIYTGCWFSGFFWFSFNESDVANPFNKPIIWKRQGETISLSAGDEYSGYSFIWSNGETIPTIEVIEPGTYTVTISDLCGSGTYSVEVRDNIEIYRATVDLETNLNKTTWQTTPEQAEYISEVKVYRDGLFVGTAPYEQGYFLDNIGSDNAARNYQIVGVTPEGEECPIASYEKGTIHTTYYEDVNGNLNMTWNIPYVEQGAQGTLTYFQICKYDPITEQLTVVDQVNSLITDYTCGVNQFEGGYPVIAAVFSDAKNRDFENLSFSNMYTDISVQPHEITITIMPGWNWISYPYAVSMEIGQALGDFVPVEGDIIKSRLVSSSYTNGHWRGGVSRFTPGWGYMYYSVRNEPATLVFDISR